MKLTDWGSHQVPAAFHIYSNNSLFSSCKSASHCGLVHNDTSQKLAQVTEESRAGRKVDWPKVSTLKTGQGMTYLGFSGLLLRSLTIWKPMCRFKRRKVELQIAGSSTPQPLIQAIIIIPLPSGKTLWLTADQLLQAWLTAGGLRLAVFFTLNVHARCVCECVAITKQCGNSSVRVTLQIGLQLP